MVTIGQWCNKNVNDGWFCRTDRTSCENHSRTLIAIVPQTFKRYFQNFLLKANQQFLEILPTTYIFQFRSIYNISGKVVRSIKKHLRPI